MSNSLNRWKTAGTPLTIPTAGLRLGISTLEVLGCVVAIAGGIWLGATYAGLDLKDAAHTVLSETELIEHVPPEWRPADPPDALTPAERSAQLQDELGSLRQQIAGLHDGREATPSSSPADAQTSASPGASAVTRDQTHAYWQQMNRIAYDESTMQHEADSSFDHTNAAQVFALKARAARLAADAIKAVPVDREVDRSTAAFAKQLAKWYENGAALYDRAVQIWESPVTSESRGLLNKEWNRTHTQHRNEARLIAEKGAALRNALSRQYGLEFQGFAQPTPATGDPTTR